MNVLSLVFYLDLSALESQNVQCSRRPLPRWRPFTVTSSQAWTWFCT